MELHSVPLRPWPSAIAGPTDRPKTTAKLTAPPRICRSDNWLRALKRSERGFLSGQRLPNAVLQHKHISEALARADFAVLDQGVDAVDHRGIARDVDDLFARVHGEGQWGRAVDLLGAVDKLSLAVDVLEGRAKDRLHRRAVARGDRRQPPRFLSEHVGRRLPSRVRASRSWPTTQPAALRPSPASHSSVAARHSPDPPISHSDDCYVLTE